jgi:membrane protease YdiL (CAAX protease family)
MPGASTLAFFGAFFLLGLWLLRRRDPDLRAHFAWKAEDFRTALRCEIPANFLVVALVVTGAALFLLLTPEKLLLKFIAELDASPAEPATNVWLALLIAPIAEETLFRGGILGSWLSRRFSPWVAILGSSAIFGLVHLEPLGILEAAIGGIVLGYAYLRTGRLALGMVLHAIWNLLIQVLHWLPEEANAAAPKVAELRQEGLWCLAIGGLLLAVSGPAFVRVIRGVSALRAPEKVLVSNDA